MQCICVCILYIYILLLYIMYSVLISYIYIYYINVIYIYINNTIAKICIYIYNNNIFYIYNIYVCLFLCVSVSVSVSVLPVCINAYMQGWRGGGVDGWKDWQMNKCRHQCIHGMGWCLCLWYYRCVHIHVRKVRTACTYASSVCEQ